MIGIGQAYYGDEEGDYAARYGKAGIMFWDLRQRRTGIHQRRPNEPGFWRALILAKDWPAADIIASHGTSIVVIPDA